MSAPHAAQTLFAEAMRARAEGNAAAARARLEALVAMAPRHVDALLMLADVLRDQGERDLSLARLRDAATASGPNPQVWRRLIGELLAAGHKSRARKLAAKAPLAPADRKALIVLADQGLDLPPAILGGLRPDALFTLRQLVEAGRPGEASAVAEPLALSHPDSAALLNLRAVIALIGQAPDRAVGLLREALARAPDYPEALANLGLALGQLGRAPDAAEALSRALALEPGHVVARINLAAALIDMDRVPDALAEIDKALAQDPARDDAQAVKATALVAASRFADARDLLRALSDRMGARFAQSHLLVHALSETDGAEAAIAYAAALPDPPVETVRRAAMLKAELGQTDAARDDLRALARRQPSDALIYRDFGLISTWTADEPLLARLEEQAQGAGPARLQDRAALNFALGRARLDTGDTKRAFDAFRRANAAQDAQLAPSQRALRPWDRQIAQAFPAGRIADFAAAGVDTVAPIFIVGMPRSGSTLVEQVLAAHPGVMALGEHSVVSPHFFRFESPQVSDIADAARRATNDLLDLTGPDRRPVDKHLHNFLILGQLAAAFPKARFLHTTRDPRDTCLSIFTNLLDPVKHPYAVDLERLGDFYVRYRHLMDHWRGIIGDRILDLSYEATVADPEPRIRALVAWLGLDWNDACLRPDVVRRRVRTISLGQVRKAITTDSVARWTAFADDLRPLTDILEREGVLP
jgi:tetratricopeptide (TPR) repeat protein